MRSRHFHRATALLHFHNGQAQRIARSLKSSKANVSRVMAGVQDAPPGFDIALRAEVGDEAAELILATIAEERAARQHTNGMAS